MSDNKKVPAAAKKVSEGTFSSAPSKIVEAKDAEKPDPTSIQHYEVLDESDPRVPSE